MKKLIHLSLIVFAVCILSAVNYAQDAIIIDHNCTDYTEIPESWIQTAKDNLRIGYGHTSHGSQLVTGMDALMNTFGGVWNFNISGWGLQEGVFFNDFWAPGDLGHNGDLTWRDDTIYMLSLPENDRNIVMWSWCGGCSDNTEEGINIYLNAMNQLEIDYPEITFVYMTGHLDGTGEAGNLAIRNQQIRDYCIANGKVLFDFADIESYDPDRLTNYMPLLCNDNCDYDSDGNGYTDSNWADNWLIANPGSELASIVNNCDSCAHSKRLNCILKGSAVWWMFARIAGWEGPGSAKDNAVISIEDTLISGIWEYSYDSANSTWDSRLRGASAVKIVTGDLSNDGNTEIIANFENYGLWFYDPSDQWVYLADSVTDFDIFTLEGQNNLIASFEGYGVYIYDYQSSSWDLFFGTPAVNLLASDIDGDNNDELIAAFEGEVGLFSYSFQTEGWTKIINANPSRLLSADITANGQNDLVCVFDGYGLYLFQQNPKSGQKSWQISRLTWGTPDSNHLISAGNITGGAGKEIIFPHSGNTYYYSYESGQWSKLVSAPMKRIITGRFTGQSLDDIIACDSNTDNIYLRDSSASQWNILLYGAGTNAMATLE